MFKSRTLLALILSIGLAEPAAASPDDEVKAAIAQAISGINAHDADRATAIEAPDVVVMEADRANVVGSAADLTGFKAAFTATSVWGVRLIAETVDVATSGDFAVYRGSYHEDWLKGGAPMTHQVNFLAGLRQKGNGPWRMAWSMVAPTERAHPR